MMKLGKIAFGAAVLAAGVALGSMAMAKELRGGSGANLPHPAAQLFFKMIDTVKEVSGGELTVRHLGPEVAPLRGAIANLQSGVIEIGNVLTLYFPAEFPNFTLISELAVLGKSGQAMSGAVTEYIATCEPCQKEFKDKGLVFLGSGASSSYQILTRDPVISLADLKGKKLRSGGAPFTRWAQSVGAVPMEISFNEEFEAAASGLIDGMMNPSGNLLNGKLYEIIGNVTMLNIGTFHAGSQFTVRRQAWEGMSEQEKKWLMQAAAAGAASALPGFKVADTEALKHVKVHEPDASLAEAHAAAQKDAIAAAIEAGKTRYGIANPEADVERFVGLVDKWNKIVAEIGEDNQEAMTQKLMDEVFSKLDLASY
jgi:TRAP-type C4-dicarboxylate transport system substrate-binding protein